MQSILRTLAIILIGFILLCFVIGFTNEPQTEFHYTQVVNSPSTIVWQTLTNPRHMSEWMQEVRVVTGPSQPHKAALYRFYFQDYDTHAFHEEKVDIYNPENRISFLRVENRNKPLLSSYLKLYELKPLRDGTTEITIKLSYRSNSFLTIVYDRLYLRERIKNQVKLDLENLRKKLEKV